MHGHHSYLYMAMALTVVSVVAGLIMYVSREQLDTLFSLKSYLATLFITYQVRFEP